MFYQLPTGKTIELTFAQWMNMTDEDIEYLIAANHGDDVENPWKGSSIENGQAIIQDFAELCDISVEEKLHEFSIED
jgi:hypothetical protein